jgi:hypothetical protein
MEKKLSSEQAEQLLQILAQRFSDHPERHPTLAWEVVQKRLDAHQTLWWSLYEMERTGGEPDVVSPEAKSDRILFVDCAPETPLGRRGVCYDRQAREQRKSHRPETSALEMAQQMGVDVLDEIQYHMLQQFGEFDLKTSS